MLIDIDERDHATILAALAEYIDGPATGIDRIETLRDRLSDAPSENVAIVQAALEDAASFIDRFSGTQTQVEGQLGQIRLAMSIAGCVAAPEPTPAAPIPRTWTVTVVATHYNTNEVTVEADTIEAACAAALIEAEDDPGGWETSDQQGRVFINAVAEDTGGVIHEESVVPEQYREH